MVHTTETRCADRKSVYRHESETWSGSISSFIISSASAKGINTHHDHRCISRSLEYITNRRLPCVKGLKLPKVPHIVVGEALEHGQLRIFTVDNDTDPSVCSKNPILSNQLCVEEAVTSWICGDTWWGCRWYLDSKGTINPSFRTDDFQDNTGPSH